MKELPAGNITRNLLSLAAMDESRMQREAAEKAKQEAEDKAFEAYCLRRYSRIKRWAMKRDKDDLADMLALAGLLLLEKKKTDRIKEQISRSKERLIGSLERDAFVAKAGETAARELAKEYVAKWVINKTRSKRGIEKKLANDKDGRQAAKVEILKWWDNGRAIGPEIPTGAAFDRAAVDKYPAITDTGTVKKWREALARGSRKQG